MKIVKYNRSKTVQSGSSGSSSGSGGSGSSTTIQGGGSVSLDRTIWGKHDTGDDIDGSMTVNGNIDIKVINYNWEEDDDDGENEDYEEGGGNLNVELKTTTKDLEVSNDAYIQKHLYINHTHSDHTGEKVCLVGEVESQAKRISDAETGIKNNADEIEKLKNRSDSSESDLSDIETKVQNNTTEINNIKEQMADGSAIDQLTQLVKYGNYSNPVILYSGVIRKLSTSDIYTNNGSYKDCMLFSITDITEGLMTIELSKSSLTDKNITINITSISAIQQMSDDTEERKTYYKERSNGAHWFEAWVGDTTTNKTTIYLREFHAGNDNNDTWYSSSWTESGGIRAVNLTISGYITFSS